MEQTESEMISTKSSKPSYLVIAVILILVVGGFLYLTQNQNDGKSMMGEMPSATPSASSETSIEINPAPSVTSEITGTNSPVMSDVKSFTLEGGAYYYKPSTLTVKKGDKVKITLTSVDMPHNFVIDSLNVASDMVSKGQSTTVEFTASKVGTFEYYCSVGNHRAKGMVGTLTVTE